MLSPDSSPIRENETNKTAPRAPIAGRSIGHGAELPRALAGIAAMGAALALCGQTSAAAMKAETTKRTAAMIVCVIRYQIDTFQRAEFKKHGENQHHSALRRPSGRVFSAV
jgi:hypothetical protein